MINIRNGVFETNSSSTHCLSVCKKDFDKTVEFNSLARYVGEDNYLHVKFMEFGWGPDFYCDAYAKLVYLVQMICLTHGIDPWWCENKSSEDIMNDLNDVDEWLSLNFKLKEWYNISGIYIDSTDGYIDHQSYEYYDSAHDFLNEYEVTLEDYLFNSNIKLIIDNDNH